MVNISFKHYCSAVIGVGLKSF